MNLEENTKFTSQEYWNNRFQVEDEFEWLGSLKDFEHVISLDDHSIIVVAGCGNSRLSQEFSKPSVLLPSIWVSICKDLEKKGHFVVSTDFAFEATRKQKELWPTSQYVTSDCRDAIFRCTADLAIEKGVLDALIADENPWRPSSESVKMVQDTVECGRKIARRLISISFHSPMVRLPLLLSDQWDVSIRSYTAGMQFYVYEIDFTKSCQTTDLSNYISNPVSYDGSDLSDQEEDYLSQLDVF